MKNRTQYERTIATLTTRLERQDRLHQKTLTAAFEYSGALADALRSACTEGAHSVSVPQWTRLEEALVELEKLGFQREDTPVGTVPIKSHGGSKEVVNLTGIVPSDRPTRPDCPSSMPPPPSEDHTPE